MTAPVLPADAGHRHADRPVRVEAFQGHDAVVKTYRVADGAWVHAAAQALWQSPFGAHRRPPGIPAPLEWRPATREVVMEALAGEPLGTRGDAGASEARAHEVARLLADLHESGVAVDRVRDPRRLSASLGRKVAESAGTPLHEPAAAALAATTRRLARDAGSAPPVICHGDFSPRNVMVTPGGLRLIDLDRLQMSAAARDVTYWGAWLWTTMLLRGEEPRWDGADRFTAAYLRHRPGAVGELMRDTPAHRAAALVRIAHGWSALRTAPRLAARVLDEARIQATA